jgi:hypothetical protein
VQPSHILGESLENRRFVVNHQIGSRCLRYVRRIDVGRRREKSFSMLSKMTSSASKSPIQ